MSAHTPGPLFVEPAYGSDPSTPLYFAVLERRRRPYRGTVATCSPAEHIGGITRSEAEANALLISEAHALLEALRKAADTLGELKRLHSMIGRDVLAEGCAIAERNALEVIAKATGEEA